MPTEKYFSGHRRTDIHTVMRSKRHEHGQDVTQGQKPFISGLPVGEKIKESLVMLFQLLLRVQRGSKLLSGSSPSGVRCRPLPSCG